MAARRTTNEPIWSYSEIVQYWAVEAWQAIVGVALVCSPKARGVFHPQPDSLIVLGVALPPDVDRANLERRLWWRGLGIVQREGLVIAGADVTQAVADRRTTQARQFVTRQLRGAGMRGAVKRYDRTQKRAARPKRSP